MCFVLYILYLAFHLLIVVVSSVTLLFLFFQLYSIYVSTKLFCVFLCVNLTAVFFSSSFSFSVSVFGCCRLYPLLFYYTKFCSIYIKEWHSNAFQLTSIFAWICIISLRCVCICIIFRNRLDKIYPKLVNYVNFILFAIQQTHSTRAFDLSVTPSPFFYLCLCLSLFNF